MEQSRELAAQSSALRSRLCGDESMSDEMAGKHQQKRRDSGPVQFEWNEHA